MNKLLLSLCFSLSACQVNHFPAPGPSLSPSPTATPIVRPTVVSSPQPTASPSPSPILSPAPSSTPGELGQEFEAAYQQAVILASEKLSFVFQSLVQDSRCPSDVTCIWAGNVTIKVQLTQNGTELGTAELTLGATPESTAKIGNYQLTLLEVTPYPKSTESRSPADYRVKMRIDKP